MAEPKYSEDYIKGFKHGVSWFRMMMRATLYRFDGQIAQGELELDNISKDTKEAVKSLRKGR